MDLDKSLLLHVCVNRGIPTGLALLISIEATFVPKVEAGKLRV